MKKRYFLVFLVLLIIPIQEAIAVNEVSQVIKVTGSLVGGVEDEDFLLPSAVTDQNKTIIFMSVRHNADGVAKEIYRSWDFVNNTAIRFHGSSDVPASNLAMDFVAYLVEFKTTSDMIKQNGTLIVDGADVDMEFLATLSPIVNSTNSFFTFDGLTMDHSDLTWGSEEFGLMRVLNDTKWGYEPFDAPNSGDTEVRFSVVDWNNVGFVRQNGTGTLLDGVSLDTIVPSPAVDRDHTMILITTQIEDELDATADEHGVTATLNPSNSIEIERDDAICPSSNCEVNYSWELLTFPTTFANVTHGTITETNATAGDTQQTEFDALPSPVIVNNTIAIGTVQTPLGLGQSRSSGGGAGSWDRNTWTIELFNTTHVRAITNNGEEESSVSYQVIEFLTVGGAIFNQTVTDTVTVAPEDLRFIVNKTAVDFSSFIDVSTNKNITKLGLDIASAGDTVNTNAIFVIELNDQGQTIDVLSINITKLNQDVVSGLDDLDFDIAKGLVDTATVIDQVDPQLVALLLLTDLASTNDEVRLAIIKLLEDDVVTSDEINFVINKLLQDTAIISDLSETAITFGIDELDTMTTSDLVILDITKQLFDVASAIDDLNLEATKVFLDTTIVVDQTQASTDTDVDETDIVTVPDDFVIDVTKLIQDIATVQDEIVVVKLIDLTILDTVIIDDPNIFFIISSVVPNGTGTPAGSGGGIPSGIPFFQRLVGLSINSELFFIAPADRVPSDFIIETFGNENLPVIITNIQADQQFASWFEFSSFPDTLLFDTTVDTSRTFSDPARFKNTALDDFVLSVPSLSCEDLDPFVTPVPCIDPIIYEAPVTFTFTKGGVEFREKHIVIIDATQPVICDALCEFVDFMTQNYWWLAGIVIVFMMMYFLGVPIITGKRIRTVRRVDSRHFESFDAERPRRKFKRGKRS